LNFVAFTGLGLHSGERSRIALERSSGPLMFVIDGDSALTRELEIVRTDHGVSVRRPGSEVEIDLVEHLCGALAGLSIRSGLTIWLDGPEVPLLDGGAREIAWALAGMGIPRDAPGLSVKKAAEISVNGSRYRFEPGPSVELEVNVEFDRAQIGSQKAKFSGNPRSFLLDIAPARTFGFQSDEACLRSRGRARHVDLSSVIVFDESGKTIGGEPPGDSELARHKLLDLMGDLYLFGGPMLGKLIAHRPGHTATHQALEAALEQGTVEKLPSSSP
jgi:UDP-3-O-[3-hydroxymyristoyl] N-acetylglucosamine deacetylase